MTSLRHSSAPRALPEALLGGIVRLTRRAETSASLFAEPLGPAGDGRLLPRFVVFGDHTTDGDARIAIFAGFDIADVAGSETAIQFIESVATNPASAGGVVLDVVPVLNRTSGDRWTACWLDSEHPEIRVLEREYRRLPPHAVIKVRTARPNEPLRIQVFGTPLSLWLDGAADELRALPWEAAEHRELLPEGIAGFVEDLPFRPLELHLTLPADDLGFNVGLLHLVVQRIREILSHAQFL